MINPFTLKLIPHTDLQLFQASEDIQFGNCKAVKTVQTG